MTKLREYNIFSRLDVIYTNKIERSYRVISLKMFLYFLVGQNIFKSVLVFFMMCVVYVIFNWFALMMSVQ